MSPIWNLLPGRNSKPIRIKTKLDKNAFKSIVKKRETDKEKVGKKL
jgi:hypothetical protein